MIKAVAWDIDGTLVDSEGVHHLALVAVSARYGVEVAIDDEQFVGVAIDNVWIAMRSQYPSELEQSDWAQQIKTAYIEASGRLEPLPGAMAAMKRLHLEGVRQCCVSNSARTIVDVNLAAIGALPFLEFSISRDDVVVGKPDPEPYLAACRRMGLSPASVLVVEDSDTGLASARAAGCPAVRVDAAPASFDRVVIEALGAEALI